MTIDDDDAPIVIKTFQDMKNRQAFVEELDPRKEHKLQELLAEYHMPDWIKCGLADRTDHLHGVLVRTEEGIETCIGADCAAREFPAEYNALKNSFSVRRARFVHLDVIEEYRERAPEYGRQLNDIMYGERGGHWADKCRSLYDSMCPESVREQLRHLARGGSSGAWTLTVQVRIRDEDKENDLGLGFRREQQYQERRIGTLRGGSALLKRVAGVLGPLRRTMAGYERVDPTTLTRPLRRKWVDWAKTIPALIGEARTLVALSRDLYTRENLEQLIQIAPKRDRSAVKAFIRSIEALETTREKAG
jgi:hypothetical protein